jgi:hypothetical protein
MAQINKPTNYFDTKLTTGTGSSQAITGLGFQPDWIWGKRRDSTGNNSLFDSVRGITKGLESNSTGAEFTSTDYYSSFDSDGFTIAAGASGAGNGSGQTAVQWCWLASNTTASNTDGSITSTVSANTTSGFSIVSFTGTGSTATVGHGLGTVPKMVIVKNRSVTETWRPYHSALGGGQAMALNGTNATDTDAAYWSNTAPTSTVFTVGTTAGTNGSGNSMIAYCFAEKNGFSKIGSYTGNGSTDGPFIYTGFKPAWVMIKGADNSAGATPDWRIRDNKRSTYNTVQDVLYANSSSATITEDDHDFLSNGFKVRTSGAENNYSGDRYIYMAFAENPLVGTNNIPATAR